MSRIRKNRIAKGSVLFLTFAVACFLITSGCITQSDVNHKSGSVNISKNLVTEQTTVSLQSKASYKVTIAQQNDSHADFIKMDSDVYSQGEIIEYYLINEGSETLTCAGTPPTFMIYRQNNNSWEIPPELSVTVTDLTSYLKSGESTRMKRLITTDWRPGRYKIVSDCGIWREFELRNI